MFFPIYLCSLPFECFIFPRNNIVALNNDAENRTGGVRDAFGREINYLRVSVTDRCNMRCVYCMPENATFLPPGEILTYEEIARAVRVFAAAGVRKVRLTGGEPLARKNIEKLVADLAAVKEIEDLSLTTNGLKLAETAEKLAAAGLRRVNVSLDTLDPEKFKTICRAGDLSTVLAGIRAANATGLRPVKVNVVVMRGRNENEISDFIDFSMRENIFPRFIEYMPLNMDSEWEKRFVPREEMLEKVKDKVSPVRDDAREPNAPARYYDILGSDLRAGFISPVSHGFCSRCNRMRLTPEGRLRACLLSENSVEIKSLMRNGCADSDLLEAFRRAAAAKGEKGRFPDGPRPMHSIGG